MFKLMYVYTLSTAKQLRLESCGGARRMRVAACSGLRVWCAVTRHAPRAPRTYPGCTAVTRQRELLCLLFSCNLARAKASGTVTEREYVFRLASAILA